MREIRFFKIYLNEKEERHANISVDSYIEIVFLKVQALRGFPVEVNF